MHILCCMLCMKKTANVAKFSFTKGWGQFFFAGLWKILTNVKICHPPVRKRSLSQGCEINMQKCTNVLAPRACHAPPILWRAYKLVLFAKSNLHLSISSLQRALRTTGWAERQIRLMHLRIFFSNHEITLWWWLMNDTDVDPHTAGRPQQITWKGGLV